MAALTIEHPESGATATLPHPHPSKYVEYVLEFVKADGTGYTLDLSFKVDAGTLAIGRRDALTLALTAGDCDAPITIDGRAV